MERRTKELESGVALNHGPIALQALMGEVLQRLEPLARMSDLALLRDVHSGCDGVCCADPEQLRCVLHHLILRALSLEPTPGHVRIMVTFTSREAHILILSRTPAAKLAEPPGLRPPRSGRTAAAAPGHGRLAGAGAPQGRLPAALHRSAGARSRGRPMRRVTPPHVLMLNALKLHAAFFPAAA